MPSRTDDLTIWQGDTTVFQFQLMQDEDTPLDLTGSVIVFRLQWAGGEIERTSADGGVVLEEAEGTATITLTAEETAALSTCVRYRADLRRIIDGTETTLVYASVPVEQWIKQDA